MLTYMCIYRERERVRDTWVPIQSKTPMIPFHAMPSQTKSSEAKPSQTSEPTNQPTNHFPLFPGRPAEESSPPSHINCLRKNVSFSPKDLFQAQAEAWPNEKIALAKTATPTRTTNQAVTLTLSRSLSPYIMLSITLPVHLCP